MSLKRGASPGEFHDLERDPAETHNRIDDPGYRVAVAALKDESNLRTLYRVPGGETG